jgi:hypothetical protein
MSAQSGIRPSDELLDAWRDAQADPQLRFLSVVIDQEQLVAGVSQARAGTAEEDYGLLEREAEPNVPAFFLFRLDTEGWLVRVGPVSAACELRRQRSSWSMFRM